jgi:hypothetical protein
MSYSPTEIKNISELRTFIQLQLCQHEQLEPGIFPITEHLLTRGGRPCGIHFSLHGPRSVRLSAIWETERNTVLFYSSTGERFGRAALVALPELAAVGAA